MGYACDNLAKKSNEEVERMFFYMVMRGNMADQKDVEIFNKIANELERRGIPTGGKI